MTFSAIDSALLGPLMATGAMRAVFSDTARVAAMLQAEAALARVQARFGLVPVALAPAIEAIGAEGLDLASLGEQTALAGVPVIPFVRAVQARLPPELERVFHKGATTQDILDTALVLQARPALDLIAAELDSILAGLSSLAAAHRNTPCVGRTYGQHAAPVTFGFKAAVWLAGVAEVAARLPDIRKRLLMASLGGSVGTFAGLGAHGPAVADGFAAELGLAAAPIAWHTRRARIAEAGAWLATLLGALAKMATDIAHLASTEVTEVSEPWTPGRGGSSAMPHKRNPVSCTVILSAASASKGHVTTLLDAMASAHERPPGLWHAEWHALPTLFGLASGALREAAVLAHGLVVDPARMASNIGQTQGLLFADAAAARLAPLLGRDAAHERIEHAAHEVRATGDTLQAILGRDPILHAVDLSPAFDLTPAIDAAGPWVDCTLAYAAEVRAAAIRP